MTKRRWNYNGDLNLTYGGFYWREDGADDYVLCVDVTPCFDAGGPDNVYSVETGSIYLPTDPAKRKSALECCGMLRFDDSGNLLDHNGHPLPAPAARRALVDAFKSYQGQDVDASYFVRIGRADPCACGWGAESEPDYVLRSDAKLANFVRREFLTA